MANDYIVTAMVADGQITPAKLANYLALNNGYVFKDIRTLIVTGAINGWTDVTENAIDKPELYIDSNATTMHVRILFNVTGTTQSVQTRVTVDSTVSTESTDTLTNGTWGWSSFVTVDISAKSGWHNIDTLELKPVSVMAAGYDIAAIQFYFT